jgi:uncharacterized protein
MSCREGVMKVIEDFARGYYGKLDFAHGIGHGQRVVRTARRIMEEEGGDPFLVEAGAWLHQLHDDAEALGEFLPSLDIGDETREKIREIVTSCKPNRIEQGSSLEAKIVFDSDGLEVLGPYGTVRELLCNAVARTKGWDESVHDTRNIQKAFEGKLMTETGRRMARESIKITGKFWDCYDRWREVDVG